MIGKASRNRRRRVLRFLFLLIALGCSVDVVIGQEIILSFNTAARTATAGTAVSVWLNALNPARQETRWTFPETISVRINSTTATFSATASLATNAASPTTLIPAGGFARREYFLPLPSLASGQVIVEFTNWNAGQLVFEATSPLPEATIPSKRKPKLVRFFEFAEPVEPDKPFDSGRFFKQQIFPHEAMYFIGGAKSPNAKFQISFKYQMLNEDGWLARHAPALTGFHAAYTQTSLWDLSAPSAPFFDTSYKPAFLYSWERVAGGKATDWFRLDLQGGVQHESNGKGGADSRSFNIVFLRSTFVLGREDGFQFTLQPRAWTYIGGLSDNPDLADYRGYFDLRTVLGWRRGLQLSALGRMGQDGNHTSAQFDLTYPLMKIFGNFSVYLDAQYFIGYGESLLRYNQRSDIVRAGFSLYR